VASNPVTKVTEEQYLAIDRAAEFRSEFLDGEMVARSGVSMRHARLHQNISVGLDNPLRDRGCEVFGSDFRVRVSRRMYAYPDVSVVCGEPRLADERQDILLNPVVIFEVLSPSTEKYDRGVKFQHYRTVDSLKDYVLVDQDQFRIEHYSRETDNTWTLHDHQGLNDELKIASIGVSLSLSRIYDRVELPGA
jgi:Uma2 family endonuclease